MEAFASYNDARLYKLFRSCADPQSDLRTLIKSRVSHADKDLYRSHTADRIAERVHTSRRTITYRHSRHLHHLDRQRIFQYPEPIFHLPSTQGSTIATAWASKRCHCVCCGSIFVVHCERVLADVCQPCAGSTGYDVSTEERQVGRGIPAGLGGSVQGGPIGGAQRRVSELTTPFSVC